ncbi:MAG: TetR family transcriptional regulator [Acidimicrobiia bacterium]|nr:TetR family transcriptional regulator [Acidimicrobiia bacterium]
MEVQSRRERRTAETRRAIVEAAEALFIDHGYGETTIEQIADRADIAPRTFFRYFPTKESVLFAQADAQRLALIAALRQRPAGEHPVPSLVTVIKSFAAETGSDVSAFTLRQGIGAEHDSVRAYERTVLETETADALALFIAERLGVTVAADVRPQVWAGLAMTTFRIAFQFWLDDPSNRSLPAALDAALSAAAEAIGALP